VTNGEWRVKGSTNDEVRSTVAAGIRLAVRVRQVATSAVLPSPFGMELGLGYARPPSSPQAPSAVGAPRLRSVYVLGGRAESRPDSLWSRAGARAESRALLWGWGGISQAFRQRQTCTSQQFQSWERKALILPYVDHYKATTGQTQKNMTAKLRYKFGAKEVKKAILLMY